MDIPSYVDTLAKSKTGMPVFVESISNSARPIPFLTEQHWRGYPNLKSAGMVDFPKFCRCGHEIEMEQPTDGRDTKEFDRKHRQKEFVKSIEYLRNHCNAGSKL